jgi:hypothetical protein
MVARTRAADLAVQVDRLLVACPPYLRRSVPGHVVLIDEPDSELGAIVVSICSVKNGDGGSGAASRQSRAASL